MKTTPLALIALTLCLSACHDQSKNNNACQNLSGTWQGYYSDPQGLFSTQPSPIKLQFMLKDNRVIGLSTANNAKAPGASAVSGRIWGTCKAGKITQVFLGKGTQCGHFAKKNSFVRGDTLSLYVPYENAMTGTDFMITAHKASAQYPKQLSKMKTKLTKAPTTCH
jgi:hypothetical protein